MTRVDPADPRQPPSALDSGFGALKTAASLLPLKALEIETHILFAPGKVRWPLATT
jgi:hypothetical protein